LKIVTTSWDDGHPLDFKLAELLYKYNLKGTFYIPRSNDEHKVMSEAEISELGKNFEIGGHTLTHARLGGLSSQKIYQEVNGCYQWLSELLRTAPTSFCFPGGVYNTAATEQAVSAGFKVLRTTELLSLKATESCLVPTTLQLYEHRKSTYLKHLAKRGKICNLLVWLKSMASSDLMYLVDYYLAKIDKDGGCLHIWGHSWEIEEFGLWQKMEIIFRQIGNLSGFQYLSNRNLLFNDSRKSN
jgi:hypothetical protein